MMYEHMTEKQAQAIKNFDDAKLIEMFLSYHKKCFIDNWIFEGEPHEIYTALYEEMRDRMSSGKE